MTSRLVVLSLGCLCLAGSALGYGSGAPRDACEDMIPQHGLDPQTSAFPYLVRVSKTSIKAGENVDVTIVGKRADPFKGFMLQARVGDTPVGMFVNKNSPNYRVTDCGTGSQNTATHASGDDKKEVTLIWVAPPQLKETVHFYSTVAKDGATFWVKQKSRPLTVN